MPRTWKPARSSEDLPELEGWITLPEAAQVLGVSRSMAHIMVFGTEQKIKTAHRLGHKPLIVCREAEIRKMKEDKDKAAATAVPAVVLP